MLVRQMYLKVPIKYRKRKLTRFNRMTRYLGRDGNEGHMYLEVLVKGHEQILIHFNRANRHLCRDRSEGQRNYTAPVLEIISAFQASLTTGSFVPLKKLICRQDSCPKPLRFNRPQRPKTSSPRFQVFSLDLVRSFNELPCLNKSDWIRDFEASPPC